MKTKKFLSILLTLAMVLTMVPAFSITASAGSGQAKVSYREPVYVDGDPVKGIATWTDCYVGGDSGVSYTLINSGSADRKTINTDGVYVVGADYNEDGVIDASDASRGTNSFTMSKGLEINANVKLILADGFTLTVNDSGIAVKENVSLTIYEGSVSGTTGGALIVNSNQYGICGEDNSAVTINGGIITASATDCKTGYGIYTGKSSHITINGGTVTASATATNSGYGISTGESSHITINGGTVTANGNGGTSGYGIYTGSSCNIAINGGTVTANGIGDGSSGYGISLSSKSNITINGGTVTASGTYNQGGGQGIHAYGNCNITINGGTVTVNGKGGTGGYGIHLSPNANTIINDGIVTVGGTCRSFNSITGSSIQVNQNLILKAGQSENSTDEKCKDRQSTKNIATEIQKDKYVTIEPKPVAKIGNTEYYSVQDAIDNAETCDTIKLLEDITLSEGLVIRNDITLDLNGHELASGSVANSGTITVDMTGLAATAVKLIDYTGTGTMTLADYGTVTLVGEDYTTMVIENDLYAVRKAASDKTTLVINADWSGMELGAEVNAESKVYYYGINAFGQMADAIGAVVNTPTDIYVCGSGDAGTKETNTEEGTEFTVAGTYNISGTEWANLGYLQLNPSKEASDPRYVLNIGASGSGSNLVAAKLQLRGSSDANITDSHLDFVEQSGASRGYLFVYKDSTVTVKNSVLGYDATSKKSSGVTAGAASTVNAGQMSAYIAGTFTAENSTILTAVDESRTYAFAVYDRGLASFKDSVLYTNRITIGDQSGQEERATVGRDGEIANLTLDGSSIYANSSENCGLVVGDDKDGELILKNSSFIDFSAIDMTVNSNGSVQLDATSQIKVNKLTNSGTITVDMTGATATDVTLIDAAAESDYGSYEFAQGKTNGYELTVENNDLIAKKIVPTVTVDSALTDKWFKSGETVTVFGTVTDEAGNGIRSVTLSGIGETPVSAAVTRQGETSVYDWTYTYTSIADTTGTELTITATDKSTPTNLTGSASYTLKVDTVSPTLTVTATEGYTETVGEGETARILNWYAKNASVTVKAVAADLTSGVKVDSVTLNGSAYTSGTDKKLKTDQESGETTCTFVAADNAGNYASNTDFVYAVDDSSPEIESVSVSNSYSSGSDLYYVKKGAAVTVSASVTDLGSGLKEVLFGGETATGVNDIYSGLYDTTEEHALEFYELSATDNVAHEGSSEIKIGVDGTAPVITDNEPDLVTPTEKLTLRASATDLASGVKEAMVQVNGGEKQPYTQDTDIVVTENGTVAFYFYDNVGNEAVKVATITNIVEFFGNDDKTITDEAAKENAKEAIRDMVSAVKAEEAFNGNGTGAAGSESIQQVLGNKGYVDVKLVSVGFDTKADKTTGTSKLVTYKFDVTPYNNEGEEQHSLANNITFRLPVADDSYQFLDLFHEGTFVQEYNVKGKKYVEVAAKNFSDYSYTLSNTSRYSSEEPAYPVKVAETSHGTLTASADKAYAGNTVTLTVKADKGWTLETITAKNAAGKELELTTVKNGETYTFKMPSGLVTVSATFMEDNTMLNYFVDVTADDYFYDAVLWAAENGITSGVDETHFGPNSTTTRAQMVTFLWRAAGCPEPTVSTTKFTDLKENQYYYKAVLWAVENGITNGTGETTFSPESPVTRCQAVTFLWRYEGAIPFANMTATGPAPSPFEDVATDAYYYSAVLWAKSQKITSGTSDTTFSPKDSCLRAQAVTFLYNDIAK